MKDEPRSVQRSFRLSRRTSDLLDQAASTAAVSRNALADRFLGEALRLEGHPLIRFHTGAAGRREPWLVGTRLKVRQLIASLRGEDGDVPAVAELFEIPVAVVEAAVSYYAEFRDEVDADAEWARQGEEEERARWEREQAALR